MTYWGKNVRGKEKIDAIKLRAGCCHRFFWCYCWLFNFNLQLELQLHVKHVHIIHDMYLCVCLFFLFFFFSPKLYSSSSPLFSIWSGHFCKHSKNRTKKQKKIGLHLLACIYQQCSGPPDSERAKNESDLYESHFNPFSFRFQPIRTWNSGLSECAYIFCTLLFFCKADNWCWYRARFSY